VQGALSTSGSGCGRDSGSGSGIADDASGIMRAAEGGSVVLPCLPRGTASLLLASETLYREEDFELNWRACERCLREGAPSNMAGSDEDISTRAVDDLIRSSSCCRSSGGVALFAAKRMYFGVGGGSGRFLDWLEDQGWKICRSIESHVAGKPCSEEPCLGLVADGAST